MSNFAETLEFLDAIAIEALDAYLIRVTAGFAKNLGQTLFQPLGKGAALPAVHHAGAPAQVVGMRAGHVGTKNGVDPKSHQRAVF